MPEQLKHRKPQTRTTHRYGCKYVQYIVFEILCLFPDCIPNMCEDVLHINVNYVTGVKIQVEICTRSKNGREEVSSVSY